jgi:transposase-like protein
VIAAEVNVSRSTPTDGLPPADIVRWSPQRKASVVEAVHKGAIAFDEACQRYRLSADELLQWQAAKQAHGIGGLRITRFQYYRTTPRTKAARGPRDGSTAGDRSPPRLPVG